MSHTAGSTSRPQTGSPMNGMEIVLSSSGVMPSSSPITTGNLQSHNFNNNMNSSSGGRTSPNHHSNQYRSITSPINMTIKNQTLNYIKSNPTSFHPGGRCGDFQGTPSYQAIDDSSIWGSNSQSLYTATTGIGKQVESKKRNCRSHTFNKETIPSDSGGRSGFAKISMGYGTMGAAMLNDDNHIKTRTHCYDTRAYGSCLLRDARNGMNGAAWEKNSPNKESMRVVFTKNKRDINPVCWGRR